MKTIFKLLPVMAILLNACQKQPVVQQIKPLDLFTAQNLPSTIFEISGNADTIVTGMNGTKIFIAKNTFTDADGNPCTGSVSLELKEALNPVDMVMGNMTTLSDGKILQSGGMIYVNARQGNQYLMIGSGKDIRVSVPAVTKVDSMNIYSATYDSATAQFNWIRPEDRMIRFNTSDTNTAPDLENTVMKESEEKDAAIELISQQPSVAEQPPVRPSQPAKNDTILNLVFDTAAFPEFAQYRNVQFKIAARNGTSYGDSKQMWHDMELEKTETEGLYQITFKRYSNNGDWIVRKYKVTPVLSGTDYETAMMEYNKKFEQYEQKKREIEAAKLEAERQERLAMEKARLEMERQQQLAMEESKRQQEAIRNSAVNSFSVDANVNYVFTLNKLGWANIDRLYNSRSSQPVKLLTQIRNEESYESIYISMIFDKEKIHLPGYQKRDHSFGFSHSDLEQTVLPVGSSAVVIVTAYKDRQLHFASMRITIAKQMDIVLDPVPMKKEELKEVVMKSI